jgi:multidrug resistance efflux pump
MRKIIILLISSLYLFSQEHFAKLEPIETILIKSEVNGRVVLSKSSLEGKVADGVIVKIDDSLNRVDLKNSKESLVLLKSMVALNQQLLPSLKSNMNKKASLYKRLLPIASSSQNQKDTLYASLVSAKTQYFATKEKIINLKNQIVSLKQKIASLNDLINKKSIKVHKKYLYKLYVKKGEFVNIGAPVAKLNNINRAKVTIYLSEDELKDIKDKKIYINGKKTNLKFSKIWKIADEKFLSSYRAEIILNPIDRFSTLVKVELK